MSLKKKLTSNEFKWILCYWRLSMWSTYPYSCHWAALLLWASLPFRSAHSKQQVFLLQPRPPRISCSQSRCLYWILPVYGPTTLCGVTILLEDIFVRACSVMVPIWGYDWWDGYYISSRDSFPKVLAVSTDMIFFWNTYIIGITRLELSNYVDMYKYIKGGREDLRVET